MDIPGFYRARLSNLSGDPSIDAIVESHQAIEEGEVFYVSGVVNKGSPASELDGVKAGYAILEPVQTKSPTRYLSSSGILEPAGPEQVREALQGDLEHANPSIRSIIEDYLR